MSAPSFDLGVISFGTTCLSSSYLLALANLKVQPKPLARFLIVASHGVVALNYAIGVYVGVVYMHRPGFAVYCGTFSCLWIGFAILCLKLITSSARGSFLANETSSLM